MRPEQYDSRISELQTSYPFFSTVVTSAILIAAAISALNGIL